jgi:hypothetical protein
VCRTAIRVINNQRFSHVGFGRSRATRGDARYARRSGIRDHIAASLRITPEDFDYAPFNQHGGLGAAYVALGDELGEVLNELNEVLVS